MEQQDNPQPSSSEQIGKVEEDFAEAEQINVTDTGIIYLVHSHLTPKKYVGQTTTGLTRRWYCHKGLARLLARAKAGDPDALKNVFYERIKNSELYNTLADYGVENFKIEALQKDVPVDELDEREIYYMEQLETLVPSGLNKNRTGSATKKHASESIEKMRKAKLDALEDHRNEILRGMPPYVSYGKNEDRGGEWILIQNHPKCKLRHFYVKKYGSIERVREVVLEYLAELDREEAPSYVARKANDPELRKYPGLKKTPKGYKIEKRVNKIPYHFGFERSDQSDEEKRAAAIAKYIEKFPNHVKNID
jgi:hypothetical protein